MVKLELLAQPLRGNGEKDQCGEVEHREADEDAADDVGCARGGSSRPLAGTSARSGRPPPNVRRSRFGHNLASRKMHTRLSLVSDERGARPEGGRPPGRASARTHIEPSPPS